jgi:hypothetical protein
MRRTEKLDKFLHSVKRMGNKRLEMVFRKMPHDLIDRLTADLTAVSESLEAEENQE